MEITLAQAAIEETRTEAALSHTETHIALIQSTLPPTSTPNVASITPTITSTATFSPVPTDAPTLTDTHTLTYTPTFVPSETFTATPIPTATKTATAAPPTNTPTPSQIPTAAPNMASIASIPLGVNTSLGFSFEQNSIASEIVPSDIIFSDCYALLDGRVFCTITAREIRQLGNVPLSTEVQFTGQALGCGDAYGRKCYLGVGETYQIVTFNGSGVRFRVISTNEHSLAFDLSLEWLYLYEN